MDDKGNVLVVGAQTAAGRAYARGLSLAGYRVWAPVRPLEDASYLAELGARPVWVTMLDPASVDRAVSETLAVVIALGGDGGGMGGTEELVTARFVEAAQREQVRRLVYSSALHADAQSFTAHLRQRAVFEELVTGSGLPYTVLRPAPLMEALASGPLSPGIGASGVVSSALGGDVPVSYIAARDLGKFGVLALEHPELNCETVDVGGPEPVTFRGLLPWLSRVFQRPVTYKEIPLRKLRRSLGEHGMQLLAHMNRHGYAVDMRPLRHRVPTPLTDLRTFLGQAWGWSGLEAAEPGSLAEAA